MHFSVDDETARRLAEEAERRGSSVSKLIAEIVGRELPSSWPPGYLAGVVGACADAPLPDVADLSHDDVDLGAR